MMTTMDQGSLWASATAPLALAAGDGRAWIVWATVGLALILAAVLALVGRSHRRQLARERAIAERERAINRDLRELADLKDLLLADRAAELEEREQLIAELEARNEELARFNYTVSHDLKNPLTTIKAYVGLVRQEAAAGGAEHLLRDLDRVGAAADRMHRLLEELLQLSRSGRAVDTSEAISLGRLAREAVALAEPIAERRVEVEIAPDLPVVHGDRDRLLEVFRNLLDNAVRYLGEQPAPRIEIGTRRQADGETPAIYIRDNGIGIDPRYHRTVFRLFDRLDPDGEGTGVGLALVKRIVEVHGGRVWVESEGEGRGSTFCFTLPGDAATSAEPRS